MLRDASAMHRRLAVTRRDAAATTPRGRRASPRGVARGKGRGGRLLDTKNYLFLQDVIFGRGQSVSG